MRLIYRDNKMAQLVIDPKASESYQLEAMLIGAQVMKRLDYGPLTLLRARILKYLHPAIHHFVVWKTFDMTSHRLIDVGFVCAYCTLGATG